MQRFLQRAVGDGAWVGILVFQRGVLGHFFPTGVAQELNVTVFSVAKAGCGTVGCLLLKLCSVCKMLFREQPQREMR